MEKKFLDKDKLRNETLERQYKDINSMLEQRIVKGCANVHCNYELLPEVEKSLTKEGYSISYDTSLLGGKTTIISWK